MKYTDVVVDLTSLKTSGITMMGLDHAFQLCFLSCSFNLFGILPFPEKAFRGNVCIVELAPKSKLEHMKDRYRAGFGM